MIRAISLCLVLALFLLRPAALAQNYTAIGLIAVLGITAIYGMRFALGTVQVSRKIALDFLVLALFAGIYFAYETAIAVAFGRSNMGFHLKESFAAILVICCYGFFLSSAKNNERFFRQFITIVALIGWSSFATLFLTFFVEIDRLELLRFTMKNYEHLDGEVPGGTIYFPLSMGYALFKGADFSIMRFTGFFREPGIYQAIAAYCLILASLANRSMWIRAGLVLGIVCTLSTIGAAMLVAAIGIAYFLKHRVTYTNLALAILFVVASALTAIYAPVIGVIDKIDTHATSISDRTQAMSGAVERVGDNVFGNGPFSGKEANEAITLISSVGGIGIVGFLLQVLLLSGVRGPLTKDTRRRLGACTPLLLTALFSQPIAGAAMMYVLVMVWPHVAEPAPRKSRFRLFPHYRSPNSSGSSA
jgi:hypothetical protein